MECADILPRVELLRKCFDRPLKNSKAWLGSIGSPVRSVPQPHPMSAPVAGLIGCPNRTTRDSFLLVRSLAPVNPMAGIMQSSRRLIYRFHLHADRFGFSLSTLLLRHSKPKIQGL
jgi:hypothetical protein